LTQGAIDTHERGDINEKGEVGNNDAAHAAIMTAVEEIKEKDICCHSQKDHGSGNDATNGAAQALKAEPEQDYEGESA
jgi:hypothetical protein